MWGMFKVQKRAQILANNVVKGNAFGSIMGVGPLGVKSRKWAGDTVVCDGQGAGRL